MAQVILTRAVAQHANFELQHEVDAATVREACDALFSRHPALRRYLLTDTGAVRRHVNFFVNDELIEDRRGLSDELRPDDTIHVLQAVSGGAR